MAKQATSGSRQGGPTKHGASKSALTGYGLVLLSLIVAVGASVYLLVNHISYKRGMELASWCDISTDVNCAGAISSEWSTLFGVPVPVWAVAFYATMLLAALRLGPPKAAPPREGWALIAAGYVLGTAYSLFLLYLLVFEIQIICPGCLVLDVANILGLVGVFLVVGQSVGTGTAWALKHLKSVVLGPPGMVFALGFAAVFLAGALVTKNQLTEAEAATEPIPPDRAYNIVEGYPDAFERMTIDGIDEAPIKGDPDAPVVIVEFSDFECPYCRRFADTLAALVDRFPDRVQVRFMHYPLNGACNPNVSGDGHAQACLAARAGVCAQDQGRFWELHDLMFANSRHLDRGSLLAMIRELGLDPDEFQACWDADYSLERVRRQAVAGFEAVQSAGGGRPGTPYSFVNGLLVRGARRANEIEALVAREAAPDEGGGAGQTATTSP